MQASCAGFITVFTTSKRARRFLRSGSSTPRGTDWYSSACDHLRTYLWLSLLQDDDADFGPPRHLNLKKLSSSQSIRWIAEQLVQSPPTLFPPSVFPAVEFFLPIVL